MLNENLLNNKLYSSILYETLYLFLFELAHVPHSAEWQRCDMLSVYWQDPGRVARRCSWLWGPCPMTCWQTIPGDWHTIADFAAVTPHARNHLARNPSVFVEITYGGLLLKMLIQNEKET